MTDHSRYDPAGAAQGQRPPPHYRLRLYIAGMSPRSSAAVGAMKALCRDELADCHDLEVIDIFQHPQMALDDGIVALPTVLKTAPPPLRRSIGDLTDRQRVLADLDLQAAG
jgi:circadian clock protein KaiB